jgi:acyl carrier protein
MGLDIVEIVMQTEEDFGITIDDSDAEQVQTIGNLYNLVCKLRNVTPHPNPDQLTFTHHPARMFGTIPNTQSPEDIWIKLVDLIQDQLQVDREDIRCNASFQNDLGAD